MSLHMKFETENIWDVDGIKDVVMHEAAINMNEEDGFWIFKKSQVDLLCELVTSKANDDVLIGRNSEKVLLQNVDGISGESTAEKGKQVFLCAINQCYERIEAKVIFQDQ